MISLIIKYASNLVYFPQCKFESYNSTLISKKPSRYTCAWNEALPFVWSDEYYIIRRSCTGIVPLSKEEKNSVKEQIINCFNSCVDIISPYLEEPLNTWSEIHKAKEVISLYTSTLKRADYSYMRIMNKAKEISDRKEHLKKEISNKLDIIKKCEERLAI